MSFGIHYFPNNQCKIGTKCDHRCINTGEHLIDGVVDTGNQYSFANISANFLPKFKIDLKVYGTQGPGGN